MIVKLQVDTQFISNSTSNKEKFNAFNKVFLSVFTAEDPSTAPNFHIDKK